MSPRRQDDLLADLQLDLRERAAPDVPVPDEPGTAASVSEAPVTDVLVPELTAPQVQDVPALDLRLTPLHWSLPRVRLLPGGTGVALGGGPFRLEVTVRR